MEFSQSLLLASLLLPLFIWLLLQASPRNNKRSNGEAGGGRRRQIPSPPALPVLGHLHLLKKPLHRSLAALSARYGAGASDGSSPGLLRLRFGAKRVVLVTSPAVAEECFTAHDVALADRPSGPASASRRVLTQDCPAIAMCNYGPLWRLLRRLATVHALCAHRLAATAAARDAEARAMAAGLWRRTHGDGDGDGRVAVKSVAYEFAANVIMGMVAGTRMTAEQVRRFREVTEAGLAAAGAANRHDSLPVLRMLDFGRTTRRLAGIAVARREFGQSILDDYRRRHHRRSGGGADDGDAAMETAARTVLGDLLRQQEEEERSPAEHVDDVVIRSVCLSLLQAGTDTTASTIEWAMALLLTNPSAAKKATAEIDAVVGTSRLLRESDLAGLPFLRSVVSETLRLYPLAPNHVPHEASRDIVLAAAGGHAVDRGTMVLVDVYSMQRDPAMWGERAGEFLPERFMDGGGGGNGGGWMMPFGMGRRKCPGEGLALRMVGVVLGVMMQCFEWERDGGKEVDMSEGSGLTMPMATPLVAVCRPRAEMEALLKAL